LGAGQADIPIEYDAALNERDYGQLNGLDKDEAIEMYGKEKVRIFPKCRSRVSVAGAV
jgi:2,3-bisphosphoglycerate-dependent phosphoglycerate mutase